MNEEVGFIVGSNGTILKTENGGGSSTSVSEEQKSIPNGFLLSQNYPNPFNPSTTIKYEIPNLKTDRDAPLQMVTLKVFDIIGNQVAILVNEEKPAGSYEIVFDASALSSGIYFYRLITESFTETKKMILLR